MQGSKDKVANHIEKGYESHLFLQSQKQAKQEMTLSKLKFKFDEGVMVNAMHTNEIAELRDSLQRKEEQFRTLRTEVNEKMRKISSLENYAIAPKSPFSFTIENAKEEMGAAKERNKTLYSGSFYCLDGYKARMKINLNGTASSDSSSKDTHMSIYFQILQGPFDEKLQWPMPFGCITFSLHINDELKKTRMIRSTESELVKSFYVKPEKLTGGSRGFGKFMDLNNMPDYIPKDSLKFTVEVTHRQ